MQQPLLPFPPGCRLGLLKRRFKRFLVEFELDGRLCLAHSNNSGSMLGLTRPGAPVLVSPAASPDRKLPWTLELVGLPEKATRPPERNGNGPSPNAATRNLSPDATDGPPPLWVGVNTLAPNRLLKAAFFAKALPWARGYSEFRPETRRGQSRLDALCTGPGLPPLWVECKNVTLCEDGAAAFPDAVTERGQKHLREMTDIVRSGERAAFFYCVQRADAACFGPADYVDPAYAELFFQALAAGVEAHPHLATISLAGIGLGAELPLAPVRG